MKRSRLNRNIGVMPVNRHARGGGHPELSAKNGLLAVLALRAGKSPFNALCAIVRHAPE